MKIKIHSVPHRGSFYMVAEVRGCELLGLTRYFVCDFVSNSL